MKLTELLAGRDLVNRSEVPVLLSSDVADRVAAATTAVNEASEKLERAKQIEAGRLSQPMTKERQQLLDEAQAELDAAVDEARAHYVHFVVESVGSTEFDRIVDAFPATEEQRGRYGKELTWDPTGFPLGLLTVCLRQPEIDDDELQPFRDWLDADPDGRGEAPFPPAVTALKDKLPDVVWQQLFNAAYRVNRGVNGVPKSLIGSAPTPSSEPKSEQPST